MVKSEIQLIKTKMPEQTTSGYPILLNKYELLIDENGNEVDRPYDKADLNRINARVWWSKEGVRPSEQRQALLSEFYIGESALDGVRQAEVIPIGRVAVQPSSPAEQPPHSAAA